MISEAFPGDAGAAIWERVIQLDGELSPTAARALLKVRFSAQDQERMHHLAAQARGGTLTAGGQAEADAFERLGCVLDILHSKARRVLKKRAAPSEK